MELGNANKLLAPSNKMFSIPRVVTLLGSVLVALGSGTHYMYSTYAPQLGARLQVSHTQLNVIGLAGHVGSSISSPIWGRVTDRQGPRIPFIGAFICLLVGYWGMKQMYDDGIGGGTTVSALHLTLLVVCGFLTGLGTSAGIGAAINTTAKSFPSSARASATGFVLSWLGLSAFCFTLLANTFFPNDTSAVLLLLALGTATPMLIGLFIVKPVPPPSMGSVTRHKAMAEGYDLIPSGDTEADVDSIPLLSYNPGQSTEQISDLPSTDKVEPPVNPDWERHMEDNEGLPDIHGKQLWLTLDFYLLFLIEIICSGTGIMYINNVGSISQILYAATHSVYDDVEASKWQATQVSILSLGNFAGRILIGLISDFTNTRLRLPRAYCLCLVSSLFIISQVIAINISSVETLWIATLLLGLAYGSLFGLYPSILIEWFGLAHFSENGGFLSFSYIIGSNLFSLMFGRNLDAHASRQDPTLSDADTRSFVLRGLPSERQCLDGKSCYSGSLQVALVACVVSLGLSWWAGIRDGKKLRDRHAR